MSENRSKGIVGIFILITSLFVIFLIFAFYTVSNLQDASKSSVSIDGKNAPIAVVDVEGVIMDSKDTIRKLLTAEKDIESMWGASMTCNTCQISPGMRARRLISS